MIILVAGLPGSGKSFLAGKLAAKLGAVHLNSDRIRQELHATGKYSPEDKLAIYREMLMRTAALVEQRNDAVVDATFYNHYLREIFIRLADGYTTPLFVIEVTADEGLIRRRLQQPRTDSEADVEVYERIRDEFEEITMPHLILQSTNDNLDAMLTTAINYIRDEGA